MLNTSVYTCAASKQNLQFSIEVISANMCRYYVINTPTALCTSYPTQTSTNVTSGSSRNPLKSALREYKLMHQSDVNRQYVEAGFILQVLLTHGPANISVASL